MSFKKSRFYKQTELMINCLPIALAEKVFALKGGTAINLFLKDLPRLSVDIDLVYLPLEPYEVAQQNISDALDRIAAKLEQLIPKSKATKTKSASNLTQKINLQFAKLSVVIEPNLLIRGTLDPVKVLSTTEKVADQFSKTVRGIVLSSDEIYAGKFCAAFSRQHPRDLFDVRLFFKESKISPRLRKLFLAYLLCGNRPVHEILFPTLKDISAPYEKDFAEMSAETVSVEELLSAREKLIKSIHKALTDGDKEFLLSVVSLEPKWDLFDVKGAEQFAGIEWKLLNLKKLKAKDSEKFKLQYSELKKHFDKM